MSPDVSEKLLDDIIAVAYGEASWFCRRRIERLSRKDKNLGRLLQEYRSTAAEISATSVPSCPDSVLKKVLSLIQIEGTTEKDPSFLVYLPRCCIQ